MGLLLAVMMILTTISATAATRDLEETGAETSHTIYYCYKGTVPAGYTVKANACLSSTENLWKQTDMTDTGSTYSGYKVYKATITAKYGGLDTLQFQQYNGTSWVSQEVAFSSWKTTSVFDGKLYYNGNWISYTPTTSSSATTTTSGVANNVTYYFTNNYAWSKVYAYVWNDSTKAEPTEWPGTLATYVAQNDLNQSIYKFTFDANKYDSIIFNGGNEQPQTVDISISDYAGYNAFYISGLKEDSTYNVTAYNYTGETTTTKPTTTEATTTQPTSTETSTTQPTTDSNDTTVDEVKANAFASESATFWVDTQPTRTGDTIGLVKVYKGSSSYRLYLPANADLSNLTFYHNASSLTINGTTIENGKAYDASKWSNVTCKINGTSVTLQIFQSTARSLYLGTTKDMPTTTTSTNYVQYKSECSFKGSYLAVEADGTVINSDTVLKKIKGRGNSSWEASCTRFGKYAYNISLDKKVNLAADGATASKKWSMLANNADESMMRNIVVYNLADRINLEDSPLSSVYDVYNNGTYLGSYQMTEKVEVGSNALVKGTNVDDLNEEANTTTTVNSETGESKSTVTYDFDNPTREASNGNLNETTAKGYYKYCTGFTTPENYKDGNYLLEFELDERFADEISGFISNQGQQIVLKSPEVASKAEVEYVMDRFNAGEAVAYAQAAGKTSGTTTYARGSLTVSNGTYTYKSSVTSYTVTVSDYSELFDAASFSKNYLIQELTENLDGVATSYYVNIADSESKLVAKPVWDFDWALGQYSGNKKVSANTTKNPANTDQWFIKGKGIYVQNSYPTTDNLVTSLCKIDGFWSEVKSDWNSTVYPAVKELLGSTGLIKGEYSTMLSASVAMNEDRYHFIANDPISDWGSADTGSTWTAAVSSLESWISKRSTWMNTQLATTGSDDTNTKRTIYLDPTKNTNWTQDSPRYAIYAYNSDDDNKWYSMSKDSESGYYKASISTSYAYVIFARMDPSTTTNSWDNMWNQSDDLTLDSSKNLYTLTNAAWNKTDVKGTWSLYETTKYTIVFKNYDGTVISSKEYSKGAKVTEPATPTKPSTAAADYEFAGWDKTVTTATADATYTATYNEIPKTFTVTFVNDDGTEISKATYKYGETVVVPDDPTKAADEQYAYTFAGWDKTVEAVTEDVTYTATYKTTANSFVVTATATNGGEVTGAPEEAVAYGTSVTLKATAPTGYVFDGYYVNGKKVSSNTTYTFTVTGNTDVVAKFAEKAKSELKVMVIGGSALTVKIGSNGETKEEPIYYDNQYVTVGQYVTLQSTGYDGYNFLYWTNVNGKVVSKQETYTFLFNGKTTLMAVYSNTSTNSVTFTSGYSQTNSVMSYKSVDEITLPTPFAKSGYTFKYWSIDGVNEATAQDIYDAYLQGDVSVQAVYTADEVYYNVTINNGTLASVGGDTSDAGNTSGNYIVNSDLVFQADAAPEGKKFAYWQDSSGNIISYSARYTCYLTSDLVLTAVYVDEDEVLNAEATASIDSVTYDDVANKMQVIATLSVPENYTMVSAGILATNKANVGESEETFTYDAADYQKVRDVESSNYQYFTYVWTKSNVQLGDTWFLRGYVLYKDAEGNQYTLLGDIITATRE
jgi:hypothetical protein